MRRLTQLSLRLLLLTGAILGIVTIATGNPPPTPAVPLQRPDSSALQAVSIPVEQIQLPTTGLKSATVTADGRIRVIVELGSPPITVQQAAAGKSFNFSSAETESIRHTLLAEQATVAARIAAVAPSAETHFAYQTLLNGFGMVVSAEQVAAIQALPEVKAVHPDTKFELKIDASLPLIGAPDMWAAVGGHSVAGFGTKIAVIDSGIRIDSPMFDGTGFIQPAGYPRGFCVTDDPTFCNGKIIAARWYGNNGMVPIGATANEVPSPLDILGHGSHVAGIAAGNKDITANAGDGVAETISGVAPAAWLMVYKACWDGAACQGSALLAAFDDAVADGADVINNSWGSAPGQNPSTTVYKSVIQNAVAAGVVVVFAAGNDGPDMNTINCPACVEETIAVASTSTNRIHANHVQVTGPGSVPSNLLNLTALKGQGVTLNSDLNKNIVYGGNVSVANIYGCSAWSAGALNNRIVLLPRGNCGFETKVSNAKAAGAAAVLIFNYYDSAPIVMGGVSAYGIPALMLSKSDGESLWAWIGANPSATATIAATITRATDNDWQDIMMAGSSRGPNGDSDVLKPDIAAPGVDILSAYSPVYIGTGFAFSSGTSMASPHVAGAAALMKQLHPSWTPLQIKTALTSSAANQVITKEDGATAAHPFDRGAGRLDLSTLSDVGATFDQSSYAKKNCVTQCQWVNTLYNPTNTAIIWTSSVANTPQPGITITPAQVSVPAGGSAQFYVTAQVENIVPYNWYFADIVWSANVSGISDATLPLAVYALPSEDPTIFDKVVSDDIVGVNEPFTYTLTLRNHLPTTRTVVLSDPLPATTSYIAASATNGLVHNVVNNEMVWSGILPPPVYSFTTPDLGGYVSLAGQGVNPIICTGDCDDSAFFASVDFDLYGKHFDSLIVSVNGFVTLGALDGVSYINQQLPSGVKPNHIIAPLWSDLDLQGDGTDSAGGGHLYVANISNGTGASWMVFEWENAQQKGDGTAVYTFQLWFQDGTSNFWFTYGDLTNFGTHPATIGIEGMEGMTGTSWYYNGIGTLPTSTVDLLGHVDDSRAFTFQAKSGMPGNVFNLASMTDSGISKTYWNSAETIVGHFAYMPVINK